MTAASWVLLSLGVWAARTTGWSPTHYPGVERMWPGGPERGPSRDRPLHTRPPPRAARRPAARRAALLAAVRLVAAELETGTRPADALGAAASVYPHHADVLRRAATAQARGRDASVVLRENAELAFLGHAWSVAAATGAAPAKVIARAASDCAAREDVRRAVATALSGARASAAVMAALPVLGVLLGTGMGARPLPMLVGTAPGQVCLGAGVLLDLAGFAWTSRIARRAARP
ncbi:MAG TPA: type II secretion system F family protein [Jatrophihabitantaceae bacterium]|nr:type II secretion system F family protein [Jatrophihabitantaceae bacterium]